ncbi:MAG TPA: hypothetical protein VE801_15335 [Xanthobacteraceae bacterium]|nr:hypothetical protein [Xanthobacteraceae bacterium]
MSERGTRSARARTSLFAAVMFAGAIAALPMSVHSQERFPAKTIRIIVPFPGQAEMRDMLREQIGKIRPLVEEVQ